MIELNLIQKIAIFALPVIFAITLHEAAHGYVALRFGDTTAKMLGRITLNPLRHIDPVGTVLVPTLALMLGGILFGWAKPVPVSFNNLRHPKRDMLWVAAAGPAANLLMAVLWAIVIKVSFFVPHSFHLPLMLMGAAGVFINAILMALNLIPLPPLDGGRIAVSLLPRSLAYPLARVEPYGILILLVLIFTHVLDIVLWPLIKFVISLCAALIAVTQSELLGLIRFVLT